MCIYLHNILIYIYIYIYIWAAVTNPIFIYIYIYIYMYRSPVGRTAVAGGQRLDSRWRTDARRKDGGRTANRGRANG